MEADTFPQSGVDDSLYHLSHQLQQANDLGVRVPLRDQDWYCPTDFPRDLRVLSHELSDIHQLLPPLRPGGGGCTLSWIRLPDPWIVMICAEVCVHSCLVNLEPSHRCLYLPLGGEIIIETEGFEVVMYWSPRGGWFFPPLHRGVIPCEIGDICPQWVWCPHICVAVTHF